MLSDFLIAFAKVLLFSELCKYFGVFFQNNHDFLAQS